MKQSVCLREISFTCFKTCNAVTSGIGFCGKISIFRVPSALHPSVRIFFLSLSHLLRDHWSDVFETCPRCFPRSLVVSARKWFRSVDKCGRRQHLWFSPLSHLLRNNWSDMTECSIERKKERNETSCCKNKVYWLNDICQTWNKKYKGVY